MATPTAPIATATEDHTPLEWLSPDLPGPDYPDENDAAYHEWAEAHYRGVAAGSPASVHPPQTNVVDPGCPLTRDHAIRTDVRYRFRRQDHAYAYSRTLHVLAAAHRHEKRSRRLALCGAHATLWHSPSTNTLAVRAYHCGLRCCPRCRETHAGRTRELLDRFLATVGLNRLSMITLTLAHSDNPLTEQIDRLYASFRRLRASQCWTNARPKGYAVLEIVRQTADSQWHPHLHLLADAPYIPHHQLAAAWRDATGDSYIVDIRRVNRRSRDRHRDYLCNYLTKPPTTAILDDSDLLLEWIDALHSRKVLLRFGRPTLADAPPPPVDPHDWALLGSISGLISAATRGDRRAITWLLRLQNGACVEQRDHDAGSDYAGNPAVPRAIPFFY